MEGHLIARGKLECCTKNARTHTAIKSPCGTHTVKRVMGSVVNPFFLSSLPFFSSFLFPLETASGTVKLH